MTDLKLVTLVVPVYNEEASVPLFLDAVKAQTVTEHYDFEFVFVNDGSTDETLAILRQAREQDNRIKIVDLSRNFGKELALAAGLQAAYGEAAIPMDVDLQDPPELIHDFLRKWEEGYDVVVGVRQQRLSDTAFKRRSAAIFYRVFGLLCNNTITPNAGDYRLLNRAALNALNAMPERVRFTKGLYAWVGFRQATVYYSRPSRVAGSTKWNGWKLWNFALDGITSFSTVPLRIWSYLGMLIATIGFAYAAWMVGRTLFFGTDLPGYPSLMVTTLTLGGLILMSLGIMGEYLGRIYEESKNRPLYVVREYVGFDTPPPPCNVCPHCGGTLPGCPN